MNKIFRYVMALAVVATLLPEAQAQTKKKTTTTTKKATTGTGTSNANMGAVATPPPPPPSPFTRVEQDPNAQPGYNPHSVRPIHESAVMYKMEVWRKINLNHKPNTPFFADGNEITKIIMDAVRDGRLTPYKDDSLTWKMSKEEFFKRITMEDQQGGADPLEGLSDAERDAIRAAGPQQTGPQEYFPKQLYLLEMKEDLIFDKQRSRVYYDIQSITMLLPADIEGNYKGLELPIATFRYKDLAQVFNANPNAKWYNMQNRAQDKALTSAFDLRLFHSHITKMSNPRNRTLDAIYDKGGNYSGLIAAQRAEHRLVEWENDLWDF
jgi:gliding motility associated protien GldN